jgi:hypothetical protein
MHLAQMIHHQVAGWSEPLPTSLDSATTLVLAFGPSDQTEIATALKELNAAFPNSVLMGCSSAGEISGVSVQDNTLSVSIARFDKTWLRGSSTILTDLSDSYDAGQRLAAQLPSTDLRAVFVLSCGLAINGTALVQGLEAGLPRDTIITGGLAGDGSSFVRTWVLSNGEPQAHAITAVGLYGGSLEISHGCDGGWKDFGPVRTVTRSVGSELFELDGQPALALYKTYLGDLASQLPGSALLIPLSVTAPNPDARAVVRTILAINEDEQSMTFAGDIPQGSTARLMRTNVDRLVISAEEAAEFAKQKLTPAAQNNPLLALSVSCIGRRIVMGERTEEEVEAVADHLPLGSVHSGFYSYGEIAPLNDGKHTELHNQTMTVTLFAEA